MQVATFDFEVPPKLIAQHPCVPRDAARLLHVSRDTLADRRVRDLPELLRPGDLLVVNDTRVLPTRLRGRRGAVPVEVTLHQPLAGGAWRAFARPARRCRVGDVIAFAADLHATVTARDGGEVMLAFNVTAHDLGERLRRHGTMPLPPYIRRPPGGDARDLADYQSPFARVDGAVAAPTASLHVTDALLAALNARGVERATVTLHVGAGTFLPVRVADTDDHVMHGERYAVDEATAARVNAARAEGRRVVALGTTVLRTLETVTADGAARAQSGTTALFITPGFRFRCVDLLVTNFHLPRSTLFMLVCAFTGTERMRAAYAHAVAAEYRFYSYGDACLLERGA